MSAFSLPPKKTRRVKKGKKKLTAFERMNLISEDNEHGDKGNSHDHGNKK